MRDAAELWGLAEYEHMAERFAPVHAELVERMAPQPGDRWLDVATGTGAVAVRAAAAGALVTGMDIAPALLEVARRKAPEIEFDLGDAQELPYEDGSFDVVTSAFGAIFAPDHAAVAGELARVCRDRLGVTAWEPVAELARLYRDYELSPPEGREPFEWGEEEHVRGLLGDAFELQVEQRVWTLELESGEAVFELWATSAPPFKAMVDELESSRREAFRRAYVEHCEGFRDGDRVRVQRPYLLVLGRRR